MTSGSPSTSEIPSDQLWEERQDALIASLRQQPFLLVVRPSQGDVEPGEGSGLLLGQLKLLHAAGLRHLELAWLPHPGWAGFVRLVRHECPHFQLGAASVVCDAALESVRDLDLSFAMSPVWDPGLQSRARDRGQLLVPGVFSPSEVLQAKQWGWRLVKLFPAADLGLRYWGRLQAPFGGLPWVIAAGGLTPRDVPAWLEAGHGAVALGRRVISPMGVDPDLLCLLNHSTTDL